VPPGEPVINYTALFLSILLSFSRSNTHALCLSLSLSPLLSAAAGCMFSLAYEQLYAGSCDWFVSPAGSDDNSGTSLQEPLEDLRCLLDTNACADSSALAEVTLASSKPYLSTYLSLSQTRSFKMSLGPSPLPFKSSFKFSTLSYYLSRHLSFTALQPLKLSRS
jgi:hypothetical protein